MKSRFFDKIKKYSNSEIVTRRDIERLTGGLLKTGTLANYDSHGYGIRISLTIGHKKVYRLEDVIEWLEQNTKLKGF